MIVITLMQRYWKQLLVIGLVAIIAIQSKRLSLISEERDRNENQLKLKDGELAKVVIEMGRLRSASAHGNRSDYVAPEARTDVLVRENKEAKNKVRELDARIEALSNDKNSRAEEIEGLRKEREEWKKKVVEVVVTASKFGFVAKPGLGVVYSAGWLPEVDLKVFYWNRYSVKVGITKEFGDIGITRHIDDLVPFFRLQNVELQGVYGMAFSGERRWGVGARINL